MAIRFQDKGASDKPAKKEMGGKAYVAEEPAADKAGAGTGLPFAKPVRPEKKGHKAKR